MPQMAPLNWMFTYSYTITCFLILIIFNFYLFTYNSSFKISKFSTKKIFWKW